MPKSKPRDRARRKLKPKPIKWKQDSAFMSVPAVPRPVIDLPRPELNSRMEFTFLPYASKDQAKVVQRGSSGGPGIYQVTYFLTVPNVDVFLSSIDLGELFKYGTSQLQLPPEEILILDMQGEDPNDKFQMHFLPNKHQMLSHVRLRVACSSFEEAERVTHERVSTVLSYWSYLFDVGLQIGRYEIVEESTKARKVSFGVVGRVKAFDNDQPFQITSSEYRRLFAAYREATTSGNVFYQALNFFKVIEGTLNLRKRQQRQHGVTGKLTEQFRPDEIMPDDIADLPIERNGDLINDITAIAFEKYLGQSFKEVRDDLRDATRNAIAHLADFENVLDPDRSDDVIRCTRAIPVLRYVARTLLSNTLADEQTQN
jgi:hypothetical protein